MENSLKAWISEMIEKRRARNKKVLMLSVTSFVLVFTILSAIILPAITLKGEATCGIEEHVHTDECYERVLICDKEEYTGEEDTQAAEETQTKEETEQETEADLEEESETAEEAQNEEDAEADLEEESETAEEAQGDKEAEEDKPEREIHVHTDECYELRLVCGKEEHTHTKDCYKHEEYKEDLIRIYEDDEVNLQVTLKDNSQIPADAELIVKSITGESDPEKYEELMARVDEEALDEDQAITDIRFYDIAFELDGENIEPAHGSVRVALKFKEPIFDAEQVKVAAPIKVLHFEESGDIVDVTDVIRNAQAGVTAVEFSTDSFSTFSVVMPSTTQTGNFYQRVNTIDSTTAKYLIVAIQRDTALSSIQSGGYKRDITMSSVRGNAGFYTVKVGTVDASTSTHPDIHWNFLTAVGTSGTSQIQVSASERLRLNNNTIVSATAVNSTVAYNSVTGSWRISSGTYYLFNTQASGNFSRSTINTTNSATNNTEYFANLQIYKLVNTTLTIPGNVVYDDGTGSIYDDGVKPPYASYINPSGAQSGTFNTTTGRTFSAVSDPATSKIEALLAGVQSDDGRVVTDKSVLYGKDDYGAFTTYDDGIFSVSMSALAQEYNIPIEEHLISPIDVVVMLDVSGSMAATYEGKTRAYHAVHALNQTITHIMTLHPANRVGLVLYSAGSVDMLPLARFYVGAQNATINYNNDYQYLTYSEGSTPAAANMAISTTSNLRYADTRGLVPAQTFNASSGIGGWMGTYNQHGVQRGANLLLNVTDTTYTVPASGEIVNRIPVMLMISDGEPTHSTNNFMDPMNGPHFGSGISDANSGGNGKGIHGYNTILTEVHFKKMVASHYKEVSKWYTVGLGIHATGTANSSAASGDHYKRAVLSPTPDSVAFLLSDSGATNHTYSSLMLSQLLNGTYSGSTVTVQTDAGQYGSYPTPQIGITAKDIPVAQHDFTGYNLANESYFGDFDTISLANILMGVIDRSRVVYNYKFNLKEILSMEHVHMTDPIGVGMELKGDPIMRHNGVNYAHTSVSTVTVGGVTTKTYHYNYQTADSLSGETYNLNNIGVEVTTAADGTQTVEMHVMAPEMPVYHPDNSFTFYYEALPVRLIYQVGLTAKSLSTARTGDVFYTNRWQGVDGAMAMLRPTEANPYYDPVNFDEINSSTGKASNPTSTAGTSYVGVCDGDTNTHYLGNNGKLTVTNSPPTTSIEVNKIWQMYDGTVLTAPEDLEGMPDITVHLYQSTSPGGGGTLIDTISFGHADGWTYTWADLDTEDASENPYYYSIAEDGIDGYYTAYLDNDGILGGYITIENRTGGMVIPETGGRGVYSQMWLGLLIMLVSTVALSLPMIYKKRRILFERRYIGPSDG